ncbi:MAG: TAXI family TRAP transporter solute-binding subunit [Spirochaetaceae bacterium]|nr:TAXI family TRAP transporter solute-binding subunit [Spirochaetaceae bacterium]
MKRLVLFLLITVLLTSFAFATGSGETGGKKYTAIMGSSSLGGSWYPFVSRMAGVAMKHGNIVVTVQSSGGGTENVRLMRQGQYNMGMCEPNVANYAYFGTGPFEKDGKYDNLMFLFNAYNLPLTAVVHKDGPVKTMRDFDRKVSGKSYGFSPGSPGSGDEYSWLEVFEIYGVKKEDMNWRPLSHNERVMAFKDRILDCVAFETAQPAGAIIELSAQNPIRILPIDGKDREEIIKRLPWYDYYTLPGGMYNGQTEPVETIFLGGFALANKDVPADFIYAYVAAIFGPGLEEVQSVFPSAKDVTVSNALRGNPYGPNTIPYHPGAEKFWREKGLIK